MLVISDLTPREPVDGYQIFRRQYCHLKAEVTWSNIKIEAVRSSETLVSAWKSTRCHSLEDQHGHGHLRRRENLKSHSCIAVTASNTTITSAVKITKMTNDDHQNLLLIFKINYTFLEKPFNASIFRHEIILKQNKRFWEDLWRRLSIKRFHLHTQASSNYIECPTSLEP
jgi:hypothetical protein